MLNLLIPKLHREGYRFVAISAVVTFIFLLINNYLGVLGLIFTIWVYYFFRDPDRFSIKNSNGDEVILVQIAGMIARRIVCDVREGDTINQGNRFGIIRFWSKVDIYFQNYKLLVRKGQNTVAGETLLAKKN